MSRWRRVAKDVTFNTGTGTGTKQTTVLNPDDLSQCRALWLRVHCTKAVTDAVDVLLVKLQCTQNGGLTWEDRIALSLDGSLSPDATTPSETAGVIFQEKELGPTEEAGQPATLTADAVKHGPFPPPYRDATLTTFAFQSSWRVVISLTDADNDADFEGTFDVLAR